MMLTVCRQRIHYYQLGLATLLACSLPVVYAVDNVEESTGEELMQHVYDRHEQFPYIYEEQSLVLEDSQGKRDTRRTRRYTRVEEDGTVRFLLLFEHPEDIRGVALLAERAPGGQIKKYIYLPALGEELIESVSTESEGNFLGTDFSVEDLTGEDLSHYRYVRRDDTEIDGIQFHVVDVFDPETETDKPVRRHFIRKDNLYITLTHHYDRQGRLSRLQSQHDLRPVDGDMWRADMILMIDRKEDHQTLIKVSRRVYSSDYVPAEVFSADWLFENYPYVEPESVEKEEIIMPSQKEEVTE